MELRQLATFSTLAHTLNFTRAAALLNYAQSSVTAQIQALEEELGTPLFNRLGRRVTLTDAGQRFLSYAERVLALGI
jgi:DNA-binding transcriptional LysR family regulator